jgi:hypothetical protein
MMKMMLAIDKDSFAGNREVTCYSCHRGSLRPEGIPLVEDEVQSKSRAAAVPAEQKLPVNMPTANEIIDAYIRALGGAAAIERITSREENGSTTVSGQAVRIEVFDQEPDKQTVIRHMPSGDGMTVFNGHEGWSSIPGQPVRDMQGADLDAAQIDADLHFPLHMKQTFAELRVEYPENLGNRETYVISETRDGQPPVRFYFDEQSGLLERLVRYAPSPLGLVPTQVDYGDYRNVDGVEIPFRMMVAQAGETSTLQVEQVRQNVPIDDAEFAKPKTPLPGSAGP